MNIVKSEKILKAIPLMQELDDSSLDLILDAIKSCQAVQALSQLSQSTTFGNTLIQLKQAVACEQK